VPTGYPEGSTMTDIALLPSTRAASRLIAAAGDHAGTIPSPGSVPRSALTVEDVYTQNCRLWVRLREKGGKRHAMPCHHNLDGYLVAYLDGAPAR
jgi:hypothetical protein